MKKKILAMLLASAMVLSMAACKKEPGSSSNTGGDGNTGGSTDTAGKKVINVYAFTDEVPNMIKRYMELNPDFAAKYAIKETIVASEDDAYVTALNAALQQKSGAPDLYAAEAAFVLRYTQGDASGYAMTYKDLGIDIDKGITDAEIATYAYEIGTRPSDNAVVALPYQATGGALIYRRSIAKDVWGTDDPATIQSKVGPGWDKFLTAAGELGDKGYKIVSGSGDVWHALENGSKKGWLVDGKLYIDPDREKLFDVSKTLKDNNWMNDTTDWTDPWYADMGKNSKVFSFFGPAWLINYVMGPNAPDSSGDWAICEPPAGFSWGGTWVIANKNLNPDVKDAVKEIIEWITLDTTTNGLQYKWANGSLYEGSTAFPDQAKDFADGNSTKDTVASAKVMKSSTGEVAYLGGQNMFDIFAPAGANARGDNKTQYDDAINGQFRDQVNQYIAGEKSKEDAIKDFKQKVKDLLDFDAA